MALRTRLRGRRRRCGFSLKRLSGLLGITMDNRGGSMGGFFGELLEFSGLAPQLRCFAPEFHFQCRQFTTRLFSACSRLLVAPSMDLTCNASFRPCSRSAAFSLVSCTRPFLGSVTSRASSLRALASRSKLSVSSLTFFLSWSSSLATALPILCLPIDLLFAPIGWFTSQLRYTRGLRRRKVVAFTRKGIEFERAEDLPKQSVSHLTRQSGGTVGSNPTRSTVQSHSFRRFRRIESKSAPVRGRSAFSKSLVRGHLLRFDREVVDVNQAGTIAAR
jgi:hypothetical protein